MNREIPLSLEDYQRIYEVINGVRRPAGGRAHRACDFFAVAGATLLQERYALNAEFHAGSAAFQLGAGSVLVFGRARDGELVANQEAFHAWVEVDGYAIDFMAPLFSDVGREGGLPAAPRRMFQKPLVASKGTLPN